MGCTVFAEGDGLFHKGSGGKGVAFPDVCLSPPPSPTGPVPVPYTNKLSASDLCDGSNSVKIQGEPTALKDTSYVSTSTGDEGGNQGGNVLTHKTKGKGYFKLWSFTVKIEGKNVCRHSDPMGQNCASTPVGGLDMAADVVKLAVEIAEAGTDCEKKYSKKDRHGSPTSEQKDAVNAEPPPPYCWECKSTSPLGLGANNQPIPNTSGARFVADHQPPCVVAYYAGNCHDEEGQRAWARDPASVQAHCRQCSSSQGGYMSAYSKFLGSI
jgi:hypothetical protein